MEQRDNVADAVGIGGHGGILADGADKTGRPDVDTVRRKVPHHGEAVVVLLNCPADPSTRLPRYGGSRAGWPQPSLATNDAAGQPVDDVAELYRQEGFTVELHYLGDPPGLTGDLRADRIRLLIHDGRIVDATQA